MSADRVTRLFESAVGDHGHRSVELWLAYIRCEHARRNFVRAGQLHWRAVKQLAPELQAAFVEQYNAIK